MIEGARRERHEGRESLFSSRAAALVSRVSHRSMLSHAHGQLKEKKETAHSLGDKWLFSIGCFCFLLQISWIFACDLHFCWTWTLPHNFSSFFASFLRNKVCKNGTPLEKLSGSLHKLKFRNVLKTKQNFSDKTSGHCLLPFSSYREWPTFLRVVPHFKTFNYNPAKYWSFAMGNLKKCWLQAKTVKFLISG